MTAGAQEAVGGVVDVVSGPEDAAGAVAGVDDCKLKGNAKIHLEC